jgi:phosphoribosyl-AMP cyclohydrolase
MSHTLEEGTEFELDFTKLAKIAHAGYDVVPVVVQNIDNGEVLILAYANQLALDHTLKTGLATFWSTSRGELWEKGKTSGDFLNLVEVRVNCEQNSLLYIVKPETKNSCHTERSGCYYRSLDSKSKKLTFH